MKRKKTLFSTMFFLLLKLVSAGVSLVGGLIIYKRYQSSQKWGYYKLQKDMSGRVVVITGGSSGLGFETTKVFASCGAHIVWGCRSREKASIKKKEMR
jgi:NADPH:quinone reductase-like Zn-dependent oxidoreductase